MQKNNKCDEDMKNNLFALILNMRDICYKNHKYTWSLFKFYLTKAQDNEYVFH